MAIHEGDANRRLASEAVNIHLLPYDEVPTQYQKKFLELKGKIEETIKSLPASGLTPTKLIRTGNKTAADFLKLLLAIENYYEDD